MMSLLSIIVFWVDVAPFSLFSSPICASASATYDAIELSESKVFLEVGDSFEISLKNAIESSVKWKSKNKSIASITKKGKIKAKKVGKTKITATYNGQKYKCTVTVAAKGKGYPAANPQSEVSGSAYCAGTDVYISSGDLFITNSYAIIYELSHALEGSYHDWYLNKTLTEGFAQYTAYKVLKKLCSTDMKDASGLSHYQATINDVRISPESSVYTQTFEYWMENEFPTTYAFNTSYATGFRFMAYLDTKYGNYCNHIKRTQEMLGNTPATSNSADINQVKTLLAASYSNDVIDGFYPWLKSNESFFAPKDTFNYDYSNTSRPIILFPSFNAVSNSTFLGANTDSKITYNNLVVDISKAVTYLRDYKHINVSSLVLQVDVTAKVTLYDANGKYIRSSYGQTEIPVTGVAYVKLDSTGQTLFRLKGYAEYHP
ncbi:Ig-like domain-containing protein [Butyrivibrio sp. WCD2001]|uniref:Ig-like domain-containing protein n=1 Tax=Butyrivibrio sp. WCD2001 TaxID=1280681 RepID=UPI0003F9DD76|nr:Ig-like domain-containing protein [Butyrivibrio sp. WCD2001]